MPQRSLALIFIQAFFIAAIAGSAWAQLVPAPAKEAGYTVKTFSGIFSSTTVDMDSTGKSGFSWYPWNFFGWRNSPSDFAINSDGSLTIKGTEINSSIVTATPANNKAGFVGTAFGGGAYIEAALKFNPATVAPDNSKGWPAFWSMAIEHLLLRGGDQWQGLNSGYEHFIEPDFFEYDLLPSNRGTQMYGGNMHEWWGVYKSTCLQGGYCQAQLPFSTVIRPVPADTNFTVYHTYGFLWVPATATTKGRAQYFFDGQQVGETTEWQQFTTQKSLPTGQPWQFGVLDTQHLALVVGSGLNAPLTVDSVVVWQKSANQNLHY